MDIFGLIGSIVYHFPRFIKDRMENAVFLHPQEKLPDRHTGTHIGIVIGGATGRIEKAIELHKQGIVDYFLVTGAIGPYGTDHELAEAEVYAEQLIKSGIPDNHIWIENRATNTVESIKYSMEILTREAKQVEYGFVYPIIITSGFHLKRAHALFEKALSSVRRSSGFGTNIAHSFWSASRFTPCEPSTWRHSEVGCAIVAREAFRLLTYRLSGKI